jgi:solute carrier family 25 S-adenosylmethionine transporter 26
MKSKIQLCLIVNVLMLSLAFQPQTPPSIIPFSNKHDIRRSKSFLRKESNSNFDQEQMHLSRKEFSSLCSAAFLSMVLTVSTTSNACAASSSTAKEQHFTAKHKQNEETEKSLEESISGFISGVTVTTAKTLVKYPLDTATVRLQMPNTPYSIHNVPQLFEGSYRGISLPLLTNIPGGALFFAIKDATKLILKENGVSRFTATCLAVGVANFPYWLIRNPSEVIKTRQQAGVEGYGPNVNVFDAIRKALKNHNGLDEEKGGGTGGLDGLYKGYWENILYAFPADVVKFVCYEGLSGGINDLSPIEGALYGAISTGVAQFVTTPLDVIRNRIMAEDTIITNKEEDALENRTYPERFIKLAKEEGFDGLFAGATPRVGKAILSGAIQFATYEETKSKVTDIFQSFRKT